LQGYRELHEDTPGTDSPRSLRLVDTRYRESCMLFISFYRLSQKLHVLATPLDCRFLGEPRIIFFSNNRTTSRRLTQFTNTRREDVASNITKKNGFAEVSKNLARYKFEINFLIKIIM